MKKTIRTAIVALCAALALCGCSKSKNSLPGSYTYKTSGSITVSGEDGSSVLCLHPEQGQMHVLDDGDGRVVVTFNDISGNADVAYGTIDGNELTLDKKQQKAISLTEGTLKVGSFVVGYTGKGRLLEDMLIIDLEYSGHIEIGEKEMAITETSVHCVARKN